ncbi:MAG: outer membrane beta-barrel domain-containing protein [Bdellovibrionota bacterium]
MSFRLPIFLLIFAGFLLGTAQAIAEEQNPDADKDEYDFSWLDPEKKIYVVQNRKYTKAQKIEVALNGGIGIGQIYRTRRIVMPRLFYYFNEHFGVSFMAGFVKNAENKDLSNLKLLSSTVPIVRDVDSFYGGSVVWLPFYGKMNMFNQILYVDWHFEAGLGQVTSEIDMNTSRNGSPLVTTANYTSYHLGTGMKFFITRNIAARLDYLAVFYKAPSGINENGSIATATSGVQDSYDNHFLTLGVSYTF